MVGHYDRNAKLCSLVYELHRTILVDKSPLEILTDTIRCMGNDLKGAITTAKWILGDIPMCPIIVNPTYHICVFPTKSIKNDETIWINPVHILRTTSLHGKTQIILNNGRVIPLPCKISSFNTKLQNADQLRKITIEMANNPVPFIFESKRTVKRRKHNKSGRSVSK